MATVKEIREDLDDILTQVARTLNIENFAIDSSTLSSYGDGFVAQFYTGEVRDKDTGENTVVAIKKAPIYDYDYNGVFKNEDLFYSSVLPALKDLQKEAAVSIPFNNVPKYFCGGLEAKKQYIAMENLKSLGYVMFDKKRYLDKEHLDMILKIYGKFHALSYVLRKKNVEKYQEIVKGFINVSDQVKEFLDNPMASAVSAAIKSLDPKSDKIIYEKIKDFGDNVPLTFQQASIYNGRHRCLVHGDCWSNNMLFKYSESGKLLDIKLIDFQLCREGSPIHDLSYFFYSGGSKKDLDDLDKYLLIYFKSFTEFTRELGANPDDVFSFEELKNEWKENALFGVIFAIYVWQIKLTPKENFLNIINPIGQEKPPIEEVFRLWEAMMEMVQSTEAFRERTTAILRHAYKYGILNKNVMLTNKKKLI